MSLEKRKRQRAINFTPREQNLLFSIAIKYTKIIENKETSAVANSEKNETWMKITDEFNATSQDFHNRSTHQLKRFYENRRSALKKKKAEARQEYLKTGGGPPPKDTEEDLLILATLDPLIVEGDQNPHDSDGRFFLQERPRPINNIEYILEDDSDSYLQPQDLELIEEVQIPEELKKTQINCNLKNWKEYSTQDLKTPLNPALVVGTGEVKAPAERSKNERRPVRPGLSRRRPTAPLVRTLASSSLQQKYNELADKKNILADHAIKKIERERVMAEEEHRLKIRNLELDIEIKLKQLENTSTPNK